MNIAEKNGSDKTTLINYLLQNLGQDMETWMRRPAI